MIVAIKYLIVALGFLAGIVTVTSGDSTGAGITAAGAFIAYALIEIQDLKTLNNEKEEK